MSHQTQTSANDRTPTVEVPSELSYPFPDLSLELVKLTRVGPEVGTKGAFIPKETRYRLMFTKNIIFDFAHLVNGLPSRVA